MNTNIQDQISDALADEIISGRLKPGTVLQQEDLAARFGVSRQPIRAVLDILGARGLANRKSNRTVEVAALHDGAGAEALAIRKLLEPEALRASVGHLSRGDLLAAKQAQERFEVEEDPGQLAHHDTAFHLALYAGCGNEMLVSLIADLRQTNRRAYAGQPLGSQARQKCIDAHWQLLTLVTEAKVEEAVDQLLTHFDISRERTT